MYHNVVDASDESIEGQGGLDVKPITFDMLIEDKRPIPSLAARSPRNIRPSARLVAAGSCQQRLGVMPKTAKLLPCIYSKLGAACQLNLLGAQRD